MLPFFPKTLQNGLILTGIVSLNLVNTQSASAARFTVDPDITFEVIDGGSDGSSFDGKGDPEKVFPGNFDTVVLGSDGEASEHAEFDVSDFPIASNEVIDEAVFQVTVLPNRVFGLGAPLRRPSALNVLGYVGNGQPDASDFEAGSILDTIEISSDFADTREQILRFDVTQFLSSLVAEGNDFAGFTVRAKDPGATVLKSPVFLDQGPTLSVSTTPETEQPESVPEPSLGLALFGALLLKKII